MIAEIQVLPRPAGTDDDPHAHVEAAIAVLAATGLHHEVSALGTDGKPIAPADAAHNRTRQLEIGCGKGPIVAVSGRFVQTSVTTTVGALLDGKPIPARPCDPTPIALPAGPQELLISPGPAFVVDGAELDGPLAAEIRTAPTTSAEVTN